MSADNGIYIARFPTNDTDIDLYEYRVAHLQNIEDCNYGNFMPADVTDATIAYCFGQCNPFSNKEEAELHAQFLYDDIINSECPIIEYGISEISFNKPVLNLSQEEASSYIKNYWNDFFTKRSADSKKHLNEEADRYIEKHDTMRSFVDTHLSPPNETVYEGSVRYGKAAYEAYFLMLNSLPNWNGLPENMKQAWIYSAEQIERITLRDLNGK